MMKIMSLKLYVHIVIMNLQLDWNMEEEGGCSGSCSHCAGCVAEDDEEYKLDDDEENNNEDEDEDM